MGHAKAPAGPQSVTVLQDCVQRPFAYAPKPSTCSIVGSRWAAPRALRFEVARTSTKQLRTRLQPIRTVSEVELDFIVFTSQAFPFQAIATDAHAMRRLGMKLQAIAAALGVSQKTVWKALSNLKS